MLLVFVCLCVRVAGLFVWACVSDCCAGACAAAGRVLSWNTPLTVNIWASSISALVRWAAAIYNIMLISSWRGENRRKRLNRQAFHTALHYRHSTRVLAISARLFRQIKHWVWNLSFALWSPFPQVKLLPHTHTRVGSAVAFVYHLH